MMANPDKLDRTTAFLRANPGLHDQAYWVCGTTACYAGWTVLLEQGLAAAAAAAAEAGDPVDLDDWVHGNQFVTADGHTHRHNSAVSFEARQILGLTGREAYALFEATCHADAPERRAVELAEAVAARDRGALTVAQAGLLGDYQLPAGPAGPVVAR